MCQVFRDLRRNQWQQWSEEGCHKPMPGVWAPPCGACQKDANRVFFHGALRPQKPYGLLWTREERDRECEPRPTSLFAQLPSSDQPRNARVTTHSFISADTKLLYMLHSKILIHSFVSADTKLLYTLHFKVLIHSFVSADTILLYALHFKVLMHSFVSGDTKLLYALHSKVMTHAFVSADTKPLYALTLPGCWAKPTGRPSSAHSGWTGIKKRCLVYSIIVLGLRYKKSNLEKSSSSSLYLSLIHI